MPCFYNHGEKKTGTPDTIYYNYSHAYHRDRKWGIGWFNRKQRFLLSSYPSQPHQSMLRDLAKLLTRINIALGETSHKVCQVLPTIYSMIVGIGNRKSSSNVRCNIIVNLKRHPLTVLEQFNVHIQIKYGL